MQYHPSDTNLLYNKAKQEQKIDQLWYQVNYFQLKNHTGVSKNDHINLEERLLLNNKAKPYVKKLLEQKNELIVKQKDLQALKIMRGKLSGKLIHGLGGDHVRDTAITLHSIYGIPYIPGSSIKGAVLNWALQAFFLGEEKIEGYTDEQLAVNNLIIEIFGDQEHAGRVEFFDAFVDADFALVPDIMTPHFPSYYSSGNVPSDSDSPNPVAFYTLVAKHIEFIVGVRRNNRSFNDIDADVLLDLITTWMIKALTELGIGSKTSSGYGYFSEFEDMTAQIFANSKNLKSPAPLIREAKTNKNKTEGSLPANDSSEQGLVAEIKAFGKNDVENSKSTIFNQVLDSAREGDKEPARALKAYWEMIGEWNGGGKKQKEKVAKIKSILQE